MSRFLPFLFTLILAASGSPALAQDAPRSELSGGYQHLRIEGDSFGSGWYADAAGRITGSVSVVGQATGAYKDRREMFGNAGIVFDISATQRIHSFAGGVRVGLAPATRVLPFGQVLAGAIRVSTRSEGTISFGGVTESLSSSDTTSGFLLNFGGGVTVMLDDRFGIRGAAEYSRIGIEDEWASAFRVHAGLVVAIR